MHMQWPSYTQLILYNQLHMLVGGQNDNIRQWASNMATALESMYHYQTHTRLVNYINELPSSTITAVASGRGTITKCELAVPMAACMHAGQGTGHT